MIHALTPCIALSMNYIIPTRAIQHEYGTGQAAAAG